MTPEFEVIHITSEELMTAALAIRQAVFVEEQGINHSDEIDDYEDESRHFLVRSTHSGAVAGTARWRQTSRGCKLERFCVLPEFRRQGAATHLVQELMADIASHFETPFIYLYAQADAVAFYEKQGFRVSGDQFLECNIPHFTMIFPTENQQNN